LDGSPTKKRPEGKIAHRGAGMDAPENSIVAVQRAKKNGARSVYKTEKITQVLDERT
jgi:hypothetical protein